MPTNPENTFDNVDYKFRLKNEIRNLNQILDESAGPAEMFFEIADFISRQLFINKSVLVLKEKNSSLCAVSTWKEGLRQDGLSLNLPRRHSLFEKVLEDGRPYLESFCGTFSGNFFERKLLLDDDSSSFALVPLKSEGNVVGLVGFSSHQPTSFTLMEEMIPPEILNCFADKIHQGSHSAP